MLWIYRDVLPRNAQRDDDRSQDQKAELNPENASLIYILWKTRESGQGEYVAIHEKRRRPKQYDIDVTRENTSPASVERDRDRGQKGGIRLGRGKEIDDHEYDIHARMSSIMVGDACV